MSRGQAIRLEINPFAPGASGARIRRPVQKALGEVIRHVGLETPLVVVSGGPGTGKTLLLDMAARTCSEMGLVVRRIDRGDLIHLSLDEKSDLLLVDEADSITPEGLAALGSFESDRMAGTIVLLCLPASVVRLRSLPNAAVVEIPKLSPSDARNYLAERGGSIGMADLFAPAALDLVIEISRGLPRVLRSTASLAFFCAASEGAAQITREHVLDALSQVSFPSKQDAPVPQPAAAAPVVQAPASPLALLVRASTTPPDSFQWTQPAPAPAVSLRDSAPLAAPQIPTPTPVLSPPVLVETRVAAPAPLAADAGHAAPHKPAPVSGSPIHLDLKTAAASVLAPARVAPPPVLAAPIPAPVRMAPAPVPATPAPALAAPIPAPVRVAPAPVPATPAPALAAPIPAPVRVAPTPTPAAPALAALVAAAAPPARMAPPPAPAPALAQDAPQIIAFRNERLASGPRNSAWMSRLAIGMVAVAASLAAAVAIPAILLGSGDAATMNDARVATLDVARPVAPTPAERVLRNIAPVVRTAPPTQPVQSTTVVPRPKPVDSKSTSRNPAATPTHEASPAVAPAAPAPTPVLTQAPVEAPPTATARIEAPAAAPAAAAEPDILVVDRLTAARRAAEQSGPSSNTSDAATRAIQAADRARAEKEAAELAERVAKIAEAKSAAAEAQAARERSERTAAQRATSRGEMHVLFGTLLGVDRP